MKRGSGERAACLRGSTSDPFGVPLANGENLRDSSFVEAVNQRLQAGRWAISSFERKAGMLLSVKYDFLSEHTAETGGASVRDALSLCGGGTRGMHYVDRSSPEIGRPGLSRPDANSP